MIKNVLPIALIGILLTACGGNVSQSPTFDDAYTRLSDPTINPGDAVPVPSDAVILILTGNIGTTNVEDTLQFDIEVLEQLGVVEYSTDDKQATGDVVTFQGVLLKDLLAVAQVPDSTTTLNMVALNDYMIEIPISDVTEFPVLLATSVNGERMSVERYGPTRVVYPYGMFDLDPAIYDSRWIWQLATIEVE